MIDFHFVLLFIMFAFSLWLGGYLLGLPSDKPSLKLTGLSVLAGGLILSLRFLI